MGVHTGLSNNQVISSDPNQFNVPVAMFSISKANCVDVVPNAKLVDVILHKVLIGRAVSKYLPLMPHLLAGDVITSW